MLPIWAIGPDMFSSRLRPMDEQSEWKSSIYGGKQ